VNWNQLAAQAALTSNRSSRRLASFFTRAAASSIEI
jgi:hypothetical protein